MATIVTRAGKGLPLTNTEVDANFTNLNTDKAELSGAAFTGAITTTSTIDGRDVATDGVTADAALPKAGGAMTGAITTNSTFDGVDIATRDAVLTSTTATANAALPKAGGAMTGAITTNSTFDGRDVATDGTKLDGIEASADVTDTANVTAAGALMDSELTSIASVKALNQGVATGDSPTFVNVTATSLDISGDIDVDGTTNLDVVDIDGAVNMATTALVTGVLTTTAATVFNGGFAANAASTLTGNLGVTGVTTSGTSSVGTDNTAPSALILRHESDQSSGFNDSFGVGLKFNADASNGGYATHAELSATQKSAGYQLRFKVGGTEFMNLDSTGSFVTTPAAGGHAVFNEAGIDADFRVETDTVANGLVVDGGLNMVACGINNEDWSNSSGVRFHYLAAANQYSTLTNTSSTTTDEVLIIHRQQAVTGGEAIQFYRAGASVGSITVSSGATAYNTSSDYRLKENVVDFIGATDLLKQLKPKRFSFIEDGLDSADTDGFLAHEVQAVVPKAITGEKDGTKLDKEGNTVPHYQSIDQSKIVPLLVATIQELEARITALES